MPVLSPFDALERSFRLLGEGSSPLCVPGGELGVPFPARPIPLTELAAMVLHPGTPYEARDRALRVLIRRAEEEGGAWTVGVAGVLLPGLRTTLGRLCKGRPARAEELEAETLVALVEAIPVFDPTPAPVAARLVWRVTSQARRRLAREVKATCCAAGPMVTVAAEPPSGHPDFVLADAVRAGVITAQEAELIGETRLGGVSLHAYAAARQAREGTLRMRRMRAERRLVSWLNRRNV